MPSWLILPLFLLACVLVGPLMVLAASGPREAWSALKAYAAWIGGLLIFGAIVAGFMLTFGR